MNWEQIVGLSVLTLAAIGLIVICFITYRAQSKMYKDIMDCYKNKLDKENK